MGSETGTPKIGIILPVAEWRMDGETPRWSDLKQMATTAEAVGFDSIWVVDHLIVEAENEPIVGVWEGWTLMTAIAAVTERAEVGSLVTCMSFRNPALLAKMAETLDEVSDGRLILGLGAGHHEPEYRRFGFPFDHRVSRFEEGIQIIHGLLRDGEADVDGKYHRVEGCVNRPRGPRPGQIPIMIGTTGPRMLDLTAKYADHWNVYFDKTGNSVEGLKPLLELVDAACHKVGRDPATLERSVSVLIGMTEDPGAQGITVPYLTGTTDELAAELRAYADLGIDHIQIRVEPNTVGNIEALQPVLASVR
jgi:alkanesulfonate monooxygenase SsuD/methylene tetrahydromethanopterin reductase-like flavin-dependent oxidoreductase (luciferase family)